MNTLTNPTRPNILFLIMDDQRRDTIHSLGNNMIHTPSLDSLVQRGTSLTNAYLMGSTSAAVCMPSRAMIMTGKSLFHLHDSGHQIPNEHKTLQEVLRQEGYYTHHVGKWHQDRKSFNRCYCSGDRIFGFTNGWYLDYGGHWNVPIHDYDPTGEYPHEKGYMLAADKQTKMPIEPGVGGVHSSELFADAAVNFLEHYSNPEPFFLSVAFVAPHDPRQAPNEYETKYNPNMMELPPNVLPQHPFDNGDLRVRDEALEGWPRRDRAVQDHLADYYAMISHADFHIGRILETLKAQGLEDTTMVVFTADHGLALGQHGLMGKQNLYEHSIGVPLIFAGPDIAEGTKSPVNCYLFDVFPTICELVDIQIPDSVEGTSFASTLKKKNLRIDSDQPSRNKNPGRNIMVHGYQQWQRAVRQDHMKLIEYAVQGARYTQLFDLEKDPLEMNNLAAEHPLSNQTTATLKKLRSMLLDQLQELDDPYWKAFLGGGSGIPHNHNIPFTIGVPL